jgi:deoxyadenosine/deoxycytidine kinase
VYLRCDIPKLVEQIQARGRDYEDSIRLDYLKRLNERYENWYESYAFGKKIDVNVAELDFRSNPEHLGIIINRVNAEIYGLFS